MAWLTVSVVVVPSRLIVAVVPAPAVPLSEPTVCEEFRFNVEPVADPLTARLPVAAPKVPVALTFRVPAFTVVPPE